MGQRVFKTEPTTGTTTTGDPGFAFVYDEDGNLLAEYGTGGASSTGSTEYIWLPTPNGPLPIAAVINGSLFAIHTDNLNTPRRLSNTSTVAVWQWKYSAFGDEQPTIAANRFADLTLNPNPGTTTAASVTFNLRYPGQYADVESGLNYNYFRSYDSGSGRYTQADPIGLDGGWNRFAYVEGNPLTLIDRTGRCPYCAIAIAAAIGAGVGGSSASLGGGNVYVGAGIGALGGAVGGLPAATIGGAVGLGVAGGAVGSFAGPASKGNLPSGQEVITGGLVGGLTGVAGVGFKAATGSGAASQMVPAMPSALGDMYGSSRDRRREMYGPQTYAPKMCSR